MVASPAFPEPKHRLNCFQNISEETVKVLLLWFRIITKSVLLHFSLSVKAVTLIFISGRDLAISSTHKGKTGNINGKTENFNCLLRVRKYKLDIVKQKDP